MPPENIRFTFVVDEDGYLEVLLSECPAWLKTALVSGMKNASGHCRSCNARLQTVAINARRSTQEAA